jgi:hypothetical protein
MPTDPLTRAIKQRMSSLDDGELLHLWVENDRGQYSDAAFEAVRLILAERGVELPTQNEPPPMAARAPAGLLAARQRGDPGDAAFWVALLRPLLWVGVLLGASRILGTLVSLWTMADQVFVGTGLLDTGRQMMLDAGVYGTVLNLLVAGVLLLGSLLALRHRPLGYRMLVVYAWIVIVLAAVQMLGAVWMALTSESLLRLWNLSHISEIVQAASYPMILLVFLRRHEIRALFEPAAGFEVQRPLPPQPAAEPSAPA